MAASVAPLPRGNGRVQLYLNVPFADNVRARNLGAKWDGERRLWYVPHGEDILKFEAWWSPELKVATSHLKR